MLDAIDLRLLPDGEATKERMGVEFADLAGKVKPTDVFVLYLSGHAVVDEGTIISCAGAHLPATKRPSRTGAFRSSGSPTG